MTPDRTTPPPISSLSPFPIRKPEQQTLDNGLPLNLLIDTSQPIVRLDIVVKMGMYQQTKPLQAQFTTLMLREGCLGMNADQIADRLEEYGARLELQTGINHTRITLFSLHRHFIHTLPIIYQLLNHSVFPEERLQTVLQTQLNQFLINSEKVSFVAQQHFRAATLSESHPLGHLLETSDYEHLKAENLREFYTRYTDNGVAFYLSGHVDQGIISLLETTFNSDVYNLSDKQLANTMPPYPTVKRIHRPKPHVLQSAICLGWHTLTPQHQDVHKLRFLFTLLGGYFGSRLMRNIREEKGYTYGITINVIDLPETSLATITSETDTVHVESLIQEVYKEIKQLREELVSEAEIEVVRNYLMSELARTYEGTLDVVNTWIHYDILNLPSEYMKSYMQVIADITPAQIQEISSKYLPCEPLYEVIIG